MWQLEFTDTLYIRRVSDAHPGIREPLGLIYLSIVQCDAVGGG